MTPDEKIKGMVTGSGALAEVVKMYYDALVAVGFGSVEAITLSAAYQNTVLSAALNKEGG